MPARDLSGKRRKGIRGFSFQQAVERAIIPAMMVLSGLMVAALISAQAPGADARLEALLDRAEAYCVKLSSSALDFTCTEEVRETQHTGRVLSKSERALRSRRGWLDEADNLLSRKENVWVYDYQLIRKGAVFEERRVLLKENGKDKRLEDARLGAHRIGYKKLILCPVTFLGPEARKKHAYSLAGHDTLFGQAAVVVEAKPLPDHPQALAGKAWIKPADGSVLKIEWAPETIDGYDEIVLFARHIGAAPILRFISEYGIEKNGIRFLSSHKATEAYRLLDQGALFVRTKMNVAYRDFRFFTVETDVALDR